MKELISFADSTLADRIQLYHKGQKIVDWKKESCNLEVYNTASMVKSWTGIAVGILIDSGLIGSVNDQVCDYLPGWAEGCKHNITIKNLLNMSAGFNRRGARGIISKTDMNDYVLNSPLDTLPNIKFSYSNESVQLLGLLMERVSGTAAQALFKKLIFDPLEMKSSTLMKDSVGNYIVYGGMTTSPEDAAKIGHLMLNNGRYKGKQIVSEHWVKEMVTPSQLAQFYGYLWWIDQQSQHKNYAAMGDFGDLTIVYPDLNLVFIRMQDCETPEGNNMTWMGPNFINLIPSVLTKQF